MKVLVFSFVPNGADVGEALFGYKWLREISRHVELTVVCYEAQNGPPLAEQLPGVELITWPEPQYPAAAERFKAMFKPAYPQLYRRAARWIKEQQAQGRRFDLGHQFLPVSPRYPSPLVHLDAPYIMGPVGGSLETPPGFKDEMGSAKWYTHLRKLDGFRFRHDPWLRKSYQKAALVLGLAPYVETLLAPIGVQRYASTLELGIDALPPLIERHNTGPALKLLHVGRGVRTKGLRDVVRALAHLKDMPEVTLTSAGTGEEIALCQQEAQELGVADRVTFLGKIPREDVEKLYQDSDIFCFPSFREAAGSVHYEAMRWGLPTITVDNGGATLIHDDSTAIKLPVTTPEALSHDIAEAVRRLKADPEARLKMGLAARDRVAEHGLWENKGKWLMKRYNEICAA